MSIIQDNIRAEVETYLKDMQAPVAVDFYPHSESPATAPMRTLLQELSAMQPAIHVVTHQDSAKPIAPETPEEIEGPVTTLSVNGQFTGIRFLGFPGGHEFGTFLADIVDLSKGEPPAISPETTAWLQSLTSPLHLEVFTTPT